VGERLAMN